MPQAKTLPARPNLAYLKKLAKERLAAMRAAGDAKSQLADAQLAVAREYGFPSWRVLKAHVDEARSLPTDADVAAMFEAIRHHDVAGARRLLRALPSLANVHSDEHGTPLHLAAEHDEPELVRLLIAGGADTEAKYAKSAHTPLSWALTVGAFRAADALLKAGVKPDLFCAAGLGAVNAVRGCFDEGGHAAAGASKTGSSRYAPDGSRLPRPPSDPVELASDALYIACRNGQAEVVRFLLKQKVDLTFRAFLGGTPLHWAHFNGSREVIEMLLAAGADPAARDDVMKATPRAFGILVPCEWGILHLVRRRLKEDPALARVSDGRGTPLHEVARGGRAAIVKWLLKNDADPAARDADGKTPVDIAREKGHAEVLDLLERATAEKHRSGATRGSRRRPRERRKA